MIPSWRDAVVIFAGSPWDGIPVSEKHLAKALLPFAHVLYVDPPRSPLRTGLPLRSQLSRLAPGLARLTPVLLPGPNRPVLRALTPPLLRRDAVRALHRLGGTAGVVVTASLDDVMGAFPQAMQVLYGTDDFVAGASLMGIDPSWLRRREAAQLARADVVIAISDILAETWRSAAGKVHVIPNGVDVDAGLAADTVAPAEDVRLDGPIVAFVGRLTHRIDVDVLGAIATRGRSLLLVGPLQESFASSISHILVRPNVQWVGSCASADVPRYLRTAHVGITPYADTEFNRASFPLKTLEYLAAGRAVVSTNLPAARALNTEHVRVGSDPVSFADSVDQALAQPLTADVRRQRRAVSRRHGWDRRALDLADLCGLSREGIPVV